MVSHHSTELIGLNDGYSLGSLSEEGLEAANKHMFLLRNSCKKNNNHLLLWGLEI